MDSIQQTKEEMRSHGKILNNPQLHSTHDDEFCNTEIPPDGRTESEAMRKKAGHTNRIFAAWYKFDN